MRRILIVATLVLASCSSGTELTGPAAFYADVRAADFGSKDFDGSADSALLDFGNTICEGFSGSGLTYGRVVQGLVESNASPSQSQVEVAVKSAVKNLCPAYASQIPE
jgi:hypothetical protein